LRLCVLTHNYPRFRGDFSGTFIEALCFALADLGYQVTVLTPYDPRFVRSPDQRVDLRTYRYIWPPGWHRLGYMQTLLGDVTLRRSTYLLAPLLFLFGTLAACRTVRQIQPDVLHAHWVLPNGFIGAFVSRLTGTPLVVSVPGSDVFVGGQNPLFRWMTRFAFESASAITANSEDLKEVAVDLGADPTKFELIIYGVDPEEFYPASAGVTKLRNQLKIPPEAIVLLGVGRMVYKKGFDTIIQAMPMVSSAHLVLIGEGGQRAEWEALAQKLGVDKRVHFVGNVPRHEILTWYNLADIFVMPSVKRPADGLNVCVVDAMACGKPVVATNIAGNPLVVRDGDNGFLVPEQRPELLAAALNRLIADPQLRQRFGERSRERVVEEFSWKSLARRYGKLFEDVISAGAVYKPGGTANANF